MAQVTGTVEGDLTAVLRGHLSTLLVVCGPPAAGKSALAESLVCEGWVHLDKDRDGDRLSPQIMTALGRDPDDRDSADYRRFGHGLALRLLAIKAEEQLNLGRKVVVEGPFISASKVAATSATRLAEVLADRYGFPDGATTIWLTASAAVRRERMLARGASRDALKLANWESYVASTLERPDPEIVDAIIATTRCGDGALRLRVETV